MRQDISGEDQRCALRPQAFTRLTAGLAKGDVLIVTRLDGLARSTRDLVNLLGTIVEKGAGFLPRSDD
jgi:DNA invertase Pin-like site-specific DNA recombinase